MPKRPAPVGETIVRELSRGPRKKLALRNAVLEACDVTPQAFYKVFTKLRKEEVITVSKDLVSLSAIFVQRELKRIERIASAYNVSAHRSYFDLADKEKKTYRFKTLRELDLFWVHVVLLLMQGARERSPIISLLPHHWFDILRPETNEVWYQILGKDVPHFTVLTHATSAEKKYMDPKGIKRNELMFGENPLGQGEETYFNVIGDVVFEAKVDARVVPGIRAAMQGSKTDVQKLIDTRGDFRLRLERSAAKAAAIKKRIQRYFTKPLI